MSSLTITQVLPAPNSVTVEETGSSTSVVVQQSFNNTTVVVNPLTVTNYYGGGGEVSAALTGVPTLSTDLGTFAPGTVISNNTTIYGALNELDTYVTNQNIDLSNLQSDVAGATINISNNATDIFNNTNAIATNTGNIAANTGDIGILQGGLAQEITDRQAGDTFLQLQINANNLSISDNDTDIANNTSNISANASAITTLDGQVVKKTDSIDELNDVDTTSVAPLDGEVLKWDGLNWVPGAGGGVVRVEVKNDTATDFDKGDAVYVSGTHASGKPTVELADNNGAGTYPAIGLLEDDLIAGAEGFVVVSGSIFNLNTSGYAAGDALYIDSTPGALVNTRPDGATTKVQKVALVKRAHPSSGSVIVMGAGRTNDVPNIGNGNFWLGNTNGVAQEQGFDSFVGQTTQVQANLTNIGINAANISSNTADIAANVLDISTNTGNISSNTTSINTNASSISTNSAAITTKVTKTGDTMSGFLNLHADPISNLQAATKQYVDTIAAAGLHYHEPVRLESPVYLAANYNNGTNGVGATLTSQINFPPFTQLSIDGVFVNPGDRILVYNQLNKAHNGIYTVTNQGFNQPWELTRAIDADSYAPSDPDSLGQGDAFFVKEGNTGAGELYVMNTQGAITFGTTAIQFTQVASTAVYSAGNGLLLTGTLFSVDNSIQRTPAEGAFVDGDKTKLDGIASGANVNVNADWNAFLGDALILNKPTLGTAAAANVSDFIENDSSIAAQPIRQYYADTSAFPSASTWHGAIAHSHADGAMYFAHGGAWVKLGNDSDIFDGDYNSLTNQPTIPVVGTDAQAYDLNLTTFVNNFTLPTVDGSSGHVLTTNGSGTLSFAASGGSGSSTLLGLTDTPATFGSTGQVLAVNSAGTAVEFVTPSGGTGSGSQRTLTAGVNNNDWEGDIVTFGSMLPGNSFTAGKLYVWKGGVWEEAYATNTTASIGMLAIATDSSTTKMLTRGTFTSSSMTSFTTSNTLYVSANQAGSGRMMDTVPGSPSAGTVIRVCGYVINGVNGQVFFDPSKDYITIA